VAGAGDAGIDVLVDDAQGLAELGWRLGLGGGHERAEEPVVHLDRVGEPGTVDPHLVRFIAKVRSMF